MYYIHGCIHAILVHKSLSWSCHNVYARVCTLCGWMTFLFVDESDLMHYAEFTYLTQYSNLIWKIGWLAFQAFRDLPRIFWRRRGGCNFWEELTTTSKHLCSTHLKIKGVCSRKALKLKHLKYTGENTEYYIISVVTLWCGNGRQNCALDVT